MNGYERIMTTLELQEPDRVPIWELIVNRPTLTALYGDGTLLDFVENAGLDGVTIFENQQMTPVTELRSRDEWGIEWELEPNGVWYPVRNPLRNEEDADTFEPPDPNADYRLNNLKEAVKRFKGEKAITFLSHDAFEFPHYLRGMDNLFVDYLVNPDLAHKLARMAVDYKLELMERAVEEGADILLTGDDYASRTAPLMSPTHFREFILPYLQECVDLAKRLGVPFIKHTDGNLWPILDDLVSTGMTALDPLEPIANMDIGEVKEACGDRIALVGNVDCGQVLPNGTTEEVADAVKETIAKGSPGGGHILASSNSIHPGVKPENYRTMLEVGRRFGKYPIDPELIKEYRNRNYIEKYLDKE